MTDRVVLAYSGGLDTSVAARELRQERGLDVVACFVDLGQPYERAEVEARAAAAEAELHVVDAVDAFAERSCLPALHANALYEGKYPLVSALARPLIAAEVVRVARETGAASVAHGCTGKGNDQVRFEASFAALAPGLDVLAPVRETALSREEAIARARSWSIPLSVESKTYSVDENLWGRTVECGPLEDPWQEPPSDAFEQTVDPLRAPDQPIEITVTFEAGRPVALDGEHGSLPTIIRRLGGVAGRHGFGRVDMIENRLVGIKSRELYEVPAALALVAAHRDLEDLTLERDLAHEKAALERRWAELCYYGQWYGPLHAALRAFMAETQGAVSGDIRLRFFKGTCTVVGRRSPLGLYDHSLATYDRGADRFDHRQAAGFVALWSLPLKVWSERNRAAGITQIDGGAPVEGSSSPDPARDSASDPDEETRAETGEGSEPEPRPGPSDVRRGEPVWGARFGAPPTDAAAAFTRSTADRRLVTHDLAATGAHVRALHRAGVLTADDRDRLIEAIDGLAVEARGGSFPFTDADEDVHVAVERVLTERLGDLGQKVHTGRSRNDLVVTDLRLWVVEAAHDLAGRARALAMALVERAEEHAGTLLPGFTHLQRAQPVTLGHHLLAHAHPLARDADRLDRAAAAADVSSLGAGALAGSTLGLDPAATATDVGMSDSFPNSIDAVADRDFALEFLAACLSTGVHLSRLGEDLVLWCSEEFGFAVPDDAHATGSSMMPQKRNPDVAELARAQAGRILGDLVALATVLKGLPLAYNRDLQEDKPATFDAYDALAPALDATRGMVLGLRFRVDRMGEAAADPGMAATDLAEALVRAGTPFREAHRRVGALVARVEDEGRTLGDLSSQEWTDLGLDSNGPPDLSAEARVASRTVPGGPAPEEVRRRAAALRARLGPS
jgi:argininosuccinate lyase/argininosuccinate synthase